MGQLEQAIEDSVDSDPPSHAQLDGHLTKSVTTQ